MESDTNHVDGKGIEEFDGCCSFSVSDKEAFKKEESLGFDGSRVSEEKEIGCDYVDVNVHMPFEAGSGELGSRIDRNGIGNLAEGDGLSLTQKPEPIVGEDDGEREILKSQGRKRGRPSKIKAFDTRNSDLMVGDTLGNISQRTRNRVVKGKKEEVKDIGMEHNDDHDHETRFSVGDFVWGKIKSYPWWPGRIYDPTNASDFAIRYKHDGRLLVAYFGDRTFAWCDSSQLKPFEENFEEMSKKSSLKNFVNAVDVAVNEYCFILQLTKQQSQISLPPVVNAGIKEGVHLSLDGIHKFSAIDFDPKEMLDEIRSFARTICVTNMLVLGMLKSQLSAFYHTKGGYSLSVYYEPLEIEELEEKDNISMNGLARGPDEGNLSETGLETPNYKSCKRRKVKSITELLGLDTEVFEGNRGVATEEEMESQKVASKLGKRKKKSIDGDQSHVVENSVTTRSGSRKKATSEKKEDGDGEKDKRKTKSFPKDRKLRIRIGVENGHTVEELQERISPREKKISKYLSPPYTSQLQKQKSFGSVGGPLEFSDVAKMGERMTKAAGKLMGSPPILKCSAGAFQKSSKGLSSKVASSIKNVGFPDEVLSEIRSVARDPLNTRKVQSFDTVKGFLCPYRSANYKNGSDYNLYKKQKADHQKRKINSSNSKPMNQVDGGTSESKTPRTSATKMKEAKSKSTELLITFPEEFALPTKKDLMKICSKFGKLDEAKTEVIPKSSSAKMVFLKRSDAQASMDSMQKNSPFGSAKVIYEIQHLSDKEKKVVSRKTKKSKVTETQEGKSLDKHTPTRPENEPLAVIFIKQKLEEMNAMLAQTNGKMSVETKSNLENNVKELLKKVKMMTASSSSFTP